MAKDLVFDHCNFLKIQFYLSFNIKKTPNIDQTEPKIPAP